MDGHNYITFDEQHLMDTVNEYVESNHLNFRVQKPLVPVIKWYKRSAKNNWILGADAETLKHSTKTLCQDNVAKDVFENEYGNIKNSPRLYNEFLIVLRCLRLWASKFNDEDVLVSKR